MLITAAVLDDVPAELAAHIVHIEAGRILPEPEVVQAEGGLSHD